MGRLLAMRKPSALIFVALLVLAGCGGDSEEQTDAASQATAAPATTKAQSGGGGDEHAGHGGEAMCSPSGNQLRIVAESTKFNTNCLAAPANQQVTLSYENKDGLGHNIVFVPSHTDPNAMFRADIFRGPATRTFTTGPFRPGTYAFHCEVHQQLMQGTFVVK
jgi:plastocyanin